MISPNLCNPHDLAFGALQDFDAIWQIVRDLHDYLLCYLLADTAIKVEHFHIGFSLVCQ
jgi:hypothetical protein